MFQSLIQGAFIGGNYQYIAGIDSTNSYCRRLLEQGARLPQGTIVRAGFQHSGRGQMGTEWMAEADKNLTFSCVLYPAFINPAAQFIINMAVSLSVADLLDNYMRNVFIKWPNDIYAETKKIAGILIENSLMGNTIQSCIMGIGINVNQLDFDGMQATSLGLKTGKEFNLEVLLKEWCPIFEHYYYLLKEKKHTALQKVYHERLWGINRRVEFYKNGELHSGTLSGVNPIGQLIIEENNRQRFYNLKELSFVIK